MKGLYPYQQEGIKFMIARKNSLLADEMGLGKTIQAIGVINHFVPKTVLIICPATLKSNWLSELNIWLDYFYTIGIAQGNEFPDAEIVIINYDILERHYDALYGRNWGLIIMDEAHYVKGCMSKRTKAALKIPSLRRIFITGTPVINRPIELYPMLKSCFPEKIKGYWDYAKKYCGATRENNYDVKGATCLMELHDRMKNFMIRRLKNDVLKDLPPKVRQVIRIEDKEALKWEREELRKVMPNVSDDILAEMSRRPGIGEHIAKIRHQTSIFKLPKVIGFLEDMYIEGVEKIVVFAYHKDVIGILENHFNNSVVIHGGINMADRKDAVDQFQNGRANMFIGQIQAAGVGITLTAASHVVIVEPDWSPAVMNQAEDRCHRIGAKDTVNVYHIVLKGSLDEVIVSTLLHKQKIFNAVIEGDDGWR